jgi:hypothetical protein
MTVIKRLASVCETSVFGRDTHTVRDLHFDFLHSITRFELECEGLSGYCDGMGSVDVKW